MHSILSRSQFGVVAMLLGLAGACGVDEEVVGGSDAGVVTDGACIDAVSVTTCSPTDLGCDCPIVGGVGALSCCSSGGGSYVYECAPESEQWTLVHDWYCGAEGTEGFPDCESHPVGVPLPMNGCDPFDVPYPNGCEPDGSGVTSCACPNVAAAGDIYCCDGGSTFHCRIGEHGRNWSRVDADSCELPLDWEQFDCPWVAATPRLHREER